MKIRVIDFESTGESPEGDEHGLVEIAFHDVESTTLDLVGRPALWVVQEGYSRLCHPGCAIPPETSAIHHLIDEDVAQAPDWKTLIRRLIKSIRDDGVDAIAAHSVEFERKWFHPDWWGEAGPLPFICTYKAALRLWQTAPVHSNMGLRYWRMPVGLERQKAMPAHRAGPDAYVTAFLLRDMLNEGAVVEELIEWTTLPALTLVCRLGDYRNGGKGTPWEQVETSYLHWILGKDFDEDTVFTVRHHLKLRADAAKLEHEQRELDQQFRANGIPVDSDNEPPVDERQESML